MERKPASIDGSGMIAETGNSILRAAREYNLQIPRHCRYPGERSSGSRAVKVDKA